MSNTKTVTIRQNTLTNRTIGKRLRFVPLERMVSSLVDWYTIKFCKLHLINAKTNGRLVPLVPLVQMEK